MSGKKGKNIPDEDENNTRARIFYSPKKKVFTYSQVFLKNQGKVETMKGAKVKRSCYIKQQNEAAQKLDCGIKIMMNDTIFQHSLQIPLMDSTVTTPPLSVAVSNRHGKDNNTQDTSTLTPGVSCTASEMKVLQEMSLGGGDLENEYNEATAALVRKCAKDDIWTNTKFLTDVSMQRVDAMNCTASDGSIVGRLFRMTNFKTEDNTKKVAFWRIYGPVVQRELNESKSNRARVVKDLIIEGKCDLLFIWNKL